MNLFVMDRDRYDHLTSMNNALDVPIERNLFKNTDVVAIKEPDGSYYIFKNMITNDTGSVSDFIFRGVINASFVEKKDDSLVTA